jgi:uncharacterized protein YegP (UPF0339 family)
MKLYIFFGLVLTTFFNGDLFAQNDEALAVQSLHFLNKQFVLNLKKTNEPILISIDSYDYVCSEFVDIDSLKSITRVRIKYELKKVGEGKFEFVLKVGSEFKGSFEVSEVNGIYRFTNLTYVQKSH